MITEFFVYGTLKQDHINHRVVADLQPLVTPTQVGSFTLYLSGSIPFAVPAPDGFVVGERLTFTPEATPEALKRLDRLEAEGSMYRRIKVYTADHHTCWMYVNIGQPYGKPIGPVYNGLKVVK